MTGIKRNAAAAVGLAAGLAGAATAETVSYEVGGETFEGYFAAAEDPRGLVLIVHDWDGLGEYETRRADMIAALGYDAFAVDVYGAGVRPEAMEERVAAMESVLGDPERMAALLAGAQEAARGLSEAGSVVVTGYCFGGSVTIAAARGGVLDDVAGYASFHGNFPAGPDWPAETPPILVMHGGIDQNPSMEAVAAFVAEAEAAGLDYDVEIYSGADHAFTVFGGGNYQERADMRSWESFSRFLAETLGDGGA